MPRPAARPPAKIDVGDHSIELAMRRAGLCGALDEPTGRRCFRQVGHPGECTFLTVSAEFAAPTAEPTAH